MDYADYTPLLCAQSVLALVAMLIFLFTLAVTASFSAIHGNCKFFLMFTAAGNFCIILSHMLKIGFWFSIDNHDRYVMYTYLFLKIVQPLHEFGFFLTDLNNFMLIIERTIASTKHSSYEAAGTHWAVIVSCEVFSLALAAFCSYLVHFMRRVVECCAIALALDFLSLIVLLFCYGHSRRAYADLQCVGSRYQMREVEYVTRALLPACLITVLLRSFATLFSSIFPSYMLVISVFHCIQTVNSAQYGLAKIIIHQRMRQRAKILLLGMCRRSEIRVSPLISAIDKKKGEQGKAYFDHLRNIWD